MKKYIAGALLCLLAGVAAAASSAFDSWVPPTTYTNDTAIVAGTVITYNLYQGATGAEVQVQTGVSGTTFTVTSGLVVGQTVCWQVTAVIAGMESARSNESCKLITPPIPGAPTGLTIVFSP